MNLISKFISVLAVTLGIFSSIPSSSASTWTRYKNYKIHLDVPTGWQIEKDLYGMPIMVLGPERNGERAVLSVQDTPIYGLEFDHSSLIKTKDQYYEGRKKWIESLGEDDAKYLTEIPYRHLKWTNGNDGFEMGFTYRTRGLDLEERSIQVNCGKRLFLFKTLSNNKLPASDKAQLAKLVNELDCVATTAKDGPYQASPLQDFDRKFKDAMTSSVWPTRQQLKTATAPAKAMMLEALVQFYKDFEAAGGSDFYAYNKDPVKDQNFAKIKDRTDRFFSVFFPDAFAKSGYDCFFGGWPSKFVKKSGATTCGYPWDTNPGYQKTNPSCAEGKLSCNPSLFGNGVCVDVSSSVERAHATLKCEMEFRSNGKSYEDVAKDSNIDPAVLSETIDAAKDVCGQEPYASSNYGLCSTLKEKLGASITSGAHIKDESDENFINGLEEIKPENFDEFVRATEQNYKEFEARCIDEKGELKTTVEHCLEDHLAILADLEKIDKSMKDIGSELQEEEASTSLNNGNCNKADCSTPEVMDPVDAGGKTTVSTSVKSEESPDPTACTPAQEKRKKERECSWSKSMFMAGSCVYNVLTSLVSSIWGTIKAIGELIWDGVKWVGNKLVQGVKWFAGLFGYEDESAKKLNTASQTSDSAIKAFKKDPTGSAINMFKTIYDGVADFVSTDVACEKWSGVPHFSTCLIPATSWKCQPCLDKVDTVCSSVGYVVGEIAPAFVTGGMTTAIKGTATAAKISKYLGKASKLGKLTRLESKIAKVAGKTPGISKITSRAAKVESKLIKTELGIAGDLSKSQKILGKIYNVTRWPSSKYKKIKTVYENSKKIILGFKSKVFGKFDGIVAKMKKVRDANFVTKGAGWLVKTTVVMPSKLATKIISAPVRYPYRAISGYVRTQGRVYKAGLKYGERIFNKNLVKHVSMNNYSAVSKNIALYGALAKYPVTGSHMLDDFKERLSMQSDLTPSMFWQSAKEVEAQAIKEKKNPEEVKALLKKNRIDQLTNTLVMEAWESGKEPKPVDVEYLSKARGLSADYLRLESIDARLQKIAEGKTASFTQADYRAIAREKKITPSEAEKQVQTEVKIQEASAKVVGVLDAGEEPGADALAALAEAKGVTIDGIIMESTERKLSMALGGVRPKFSSLDYETWAKMKNISVEEAKQYLIAESEDSLNMVGAQNAQ